MKVIAINGSARKGGNTAILLETVCKELRAAGIETELIELGPKVLQGCIACRKCVENQDKKCALTGDRFNEFFAKMLEADGMLIGSPVYVADVSANTRALIERTCVVARANGNLLARKVGAGVLAMRRAGATNALASINYLFGISEMIIPCSGYWNMGIGGAVGEVEQDEEGMEVMRKLGENMAWLLGKIGG